MIQYIGQMTLALTYENHHILLENGINPNTLLDIYSKMCKIENKLFGCVESFREELIPYKYDEKWQEAIDSHILGFGDNDSIVLGDEIPFPEKMIHNGVFEDGITLKYIVKQQFCNISDSYTKQIFPTISFPSKYDSSTRPMIESCNYVILINYNPKNNEFKQQIIKLDIDSSGVSMVSPNDVRTRWVYEGITIMNIIDIYRYYPRILKELIEHESIGAKSLLKYIHLQKSALKSKV